MSQTPQQDFLKSISSLLRVSPKRRELLLAELEDHLEFRRAELAAKGYIGDELDRASLSEFGDPGQLAAGLTAASHRQFRRQLMRYTLATSAGVAVSLLAGISMWHNARGDAPVARGTPVAGRTGGNGSGSGFVAQNSPPAGGDGFSAMEDSAAFPGGRFVPSEQTQSTSDRFELVQNQPRGNFGVPNGGAGTGTPGGSGRGGGGAPPGGAAAGGGASTGGGGPRVSGGTAGLGGPASGQFPGETPPIVANPGATGGPTSDRIMNWRFVAGAQGDSPQDQDVRERLNKPLFGIAFEGVAFVEAMKTISDAVEVDIIVAENIRERYIQDAVIKNLTFKYSRPTAMTILKSVLEDIDGENRNLSIVIRDGVVRIIAASNVENELRVYNCRDLLGSEAPAVAVGAGHQPQGSAEVSLNMMQGTDLRFSYPVQLDNVLINGSGTMMMPALRVGWRSDDIAPNGNAALADDLTAVPNAGAADGANPPTNAGSGEGLGQPGSQNFPGAAGGGGFAPGVGSIGSSAAGGAGAAEAGGGMTSGGPPGMPGMGGGMMMGGGGFGGGGLGGGGFGGGSAPTHFSSRQQELLNTIKETIIDRMNPDVPPALQFFDGLLVVNGSAETHEKVSNLLRLLREASQQPVQQPAQIPGDVLSPRVPAGGIVPGPGSGAGSVAY